MFDSNPIGVGGACPFICRRSGLPLECPGSLLVFEKRDGMKNVLIGIIGLVLLPGVCLAADKMELKSEADRINYSVGYQIGGDFKSQGVELNPEVLVQGIQDALKKNEPLLSQEQMNATLVDLKKKLVTHQQVIAKQADAAFLAENARKEGVIVLPSGVQYKVLRDGSGRRPNPQGQRDHKVPGRPGRWEGDCHRLSRQQPENLSFGEGPSRSTGSVAVNEGRLHLPDHPSAGARPRRPG